MKQTVSELMDGELGRDAAAHVISAIEADPSLAEAWNEYHLIGEAMRAGAQMKMDVRETVHARLEQEPTVLAPMRWRARLSLRTAGAVAVAASVGFSAVIAWQQLGTSTHTAVLVASQSSQPVSMQTLSDHADAYFLAHQELTADQGLVKVTYSQGAVR